MNLDGHEWESLQVVKAVNGPIARCMEDLIPITKLLFSRALKDKVPKNYSGEFNQDVYSEYSKSE